MRLLLNAMTHSASRIQPKHQVSKGLHCSGLVRPESVNATFEKQALVARQQPKTCGIKWQKV
jgi:hypothetical protein